MTMDGLAPSVEGAGRPIGFFENVITKGECLI